MLMMMGPSKVAMDTLTTEDFNQYVTDRTRDKSPLRVPSPRGKSPVVMEPERPNSYIIPTPLDNIGCQDLLQESKCSHCGWLRKRRSISTLSYFFQWPQAYIVIHDGCLYYFTNENSKSPSGKFSFYGYNNVFRASEIQPKEAPWTFKIVHSHKEFKTYFFSASSEQEMKAWMGAVKKEMLRANGKSANYGVNYSKHQLKGISEASNKSDDSNFYKDVETDIYDDASKFIPSKDYQKKCSVKRENEDSDEELEDVASNPAIDKRPPLPLPYDKEPFFVPTVDISSPPPITSSPPIKPPRFPSDPPTAPPRSRLDKHAKNSDHDKSQGASGPSKVQQMQIQLGLEAANAVKSKKSPKIRRKPSYERTDPAKSSPVNPGVHVDRSSIPSSTSGGGSTGEDDFEHVDIEEYWASVYFEDRDKQRAHDIIQAIGEDGVYLVRPENAGSGRVLVVFAVDQTKKYRIQESDNGEFLLAKEGYRDKCLENVLCYYYTEDLPTVSSKLKTPYRLHPKFKTLEL